MRKHVLTSTFAVICLALAGCSASSDGSEDTAGPPPPPPPGAAAPSGSSAPPASAPSTPLTGAALKLADARQKVASTQTYRANSEVRTDGTLTSTAQVQVRLGDRPASRVVSTVLPAAYAGLGLPNPPTEPDVSETLVLPDWVYARVDDPMLLEANGGKHWSKMPWTAGKEQPQDFAAQLALLQKSGDIREVGQETVDGIRTTHYAGTFSYLLMNDNSGDKLGMSEKEYASLREFYQRLGFDHAEIDLWVGPDALPVRQITVTHIKPGVRPGDKPGDKSPTTTATTRYSGWGKPIDDTPPPADDVDELTPGDLVPGIAPTRTASPRP